MSAVVPAPSGPVNEQQLLRGQAASRRSPAPSHAGRKGRTGCTSNHNAKACCALFVGMISCQDGHSYMPATYTCTAAKHKDTHMCDSRMQCGTHACQGCHPALDCAVQACQCNIKAHCMYAIFLHPARSATACETTGLRNHATWYTKTYKTGPPQLVTLHVSGSAPGRHTWVHDRLEPLVRPLCHRPDAVDHLDTNESGSGRGLDMPGIQETKTNLNSNPLWAPGPTLPADAQQEVNRTNSPNIDLIVSIAQHEQCQRPRHNQHR